MFFSFPTLTFIIQIAIFYMRTEKKFERERKMTEIREKRDKRLVA